MSNRTPTVEEQRDNLSIGIYLSRIPLGVRLDQILEVVLGYDSHNPAHSHEHYERFRRAQSVGRDKFRNRTSGYFTFNAVQFGRIYLYKAMWYVWMNPQTGTAQTVPLFAGDLIPMQRTRDKDLATREATARSIRSASNIEEQRRQEAIDILAEGRNDAISVATMQSVFPWQEAGQSELLHVDASQCMGSASSLGLTARPRVGAAGPQVLEVMVLDGDGSLLMQLGSLGCDNQSANQDKWTAPPNLYHFVFANGLNQSTGNQRVPGAGQVRLGRACEGVRLQARAAHRVAGGRGVDRAKRLVVGPAVGEIWTLEGPVLIELVRSRGRRAEELIERRGGPACRCPRRRRRSRRNSRSLRRSAPSRRSG